MCHLQDEDCCLALALKRRLPSAYRWRAAARRDCGWWAGALEDMRMAARMAPTPDKKEAALKVLHHAPLLCIYLKIELHSLRLTA